eukprot:5322138-Amphidinium_carterae.1
MHKLHSAFIASSGGVELKSLRALPNTFYRWDCYPMTMLTCGRKPSRLMIKLFAYVNPALWILWTTRTSISKHF